MEYCGVRRGSLLQTRVDNGRIRRNLLSRIRRKIVELWTIAHTAEYCETHGHVMEYGGVLGGKQQNLLWNTAEISVDYGGILPSCGLMVESGRILRNMMECDEIVG